MRIIYVLYLNIYNKYLTKKIERYKRETHKTNQNYILVWNIIEIIVFEMIYELYY